jgi:hypothetical protein
MFKSRWMPAFGAFLLGVSVAMGPQLVMSQTTSQAPAAKPGSSAPVLQGDGLVFFDIPSGSADMVRLEIQNGRFDQQSVGNLALALQKVDFKAGTLNSLDAKMTNAQIEEIPLDSLQLKTAPFSFDPFELINRRRFVLDKPVNATVQLRISEKNLNSFLTNPKTMQKLEKAVNKKAGNLGLIAFSSPSFKMTGKNSVQLGMTISLANAMASPVLMNGKLGLQDGQLVIQNMEASSNGVQLPVDVASVIQQRLNEMISFKKLGKNTVNITGNKLNMANGVLDVTGTATLTRLEFGKSS